VEFEIEGRRERVGAGDFVYAPAGATHAFQGASKEPARMLIFDAPAHADSFFKDVDREVRDFPAIWRSRRRWASGTGSSSKGHNVTLVSMKATGRH